jgi:hypothetical protein
VIAQQKGEVMTPEQTPQVSQPPVSANRSLSGKGREVQSADSEPSSEDAIGHEADAERGDGARGEGTRDKAPQSRGKEVSEAKVRRQSRLPALDDDNDVGVQKEQIVTRDGKADLGFTGALLASAAPASAPRGRWQEYRIYQTNGGKHVFSKVTRTVFVDEDDAYEAEVFDPAPSSVPSQLLRSAREIARSRPLTWMDGAIAFFGYDPLAKVLYRKLSGGFEEQIS